MIMRTLSIIKPDGVKNAHIGDIINRFEKNNFKIVAMKMLNLTKAQAREFYAVHSARPFFNSLTEFMSSGPIVVLALEGDNAIERLRKLMGATDPAKADKGTLRADFATNIEYNAVHGSDSPENAKTELGYFFGDL